MLLSICRIFRLIIYLSDIEGELKISKFMTDSKESRTYFSVVDVYFVDEKTSGQNDL